MVDLELCRTSRGSVGVDVSFDSLVSLGSISISSVAIREGLMIYLASSLVFAAFVLFLLGTGILHSIEKATQFVHGTLDYVNNRPWRCNDGLTQVMLHHIGPWGNDVSVSMRGHLGNVPCVSGMFLKAANVSNMLCTNSDDSVLVLLLGVSWCPCVMLTNAGLSIRSSRIAYFEWKKHPHFSTEDLGSCGRLDMLVEA